MGATKGVSHPSPVPCAPFFADGAADIFLKDLFFLFHFCLNKSGVKFKAEPWLPARRS
jgi:hypothetical protein